VTVDLPVPLLTAFLLALARSSAWVVIAPPFNTRSIPTLVKIGLAGSLALFVAPQLSSRVVQLDGPGLLAAVAVQVAAGLTLGFLALLLFSAVQAAGSLVDLFGGFTIAAAYDTMSNAQSSVFGRFYNLLAITLLFVIDGHLLLVRGFLNSFNAVSANGTLSTTPAVLGAQLGQFMLAAVEIAAPLLAALFLAEVALGLLSRAAPQMNIFMLGFPVKILLTLLLVGLALPLLPNAVSNLVGHTLQLWR
jgi:flagellar biosynthetic protein FliR